MSLPIEPPFSRDEDQTPQSDIQHLQTRLQMEASARAHLQARLAQAHLRVAELEEQEKQAQHSLATLQQTWEAAFAQEQSTLTGVNLFPAARLEATTRVFNVVQRRDMWLSLLVKLGLSGRLMGLAPHDGGNDPLTILVTGSGGYGDMLHLSATVRGLALRVPRARLFVMHTHPGVREIFANNPYVMEAVPADSTTIFDFISAIVALDVFDLIADVRYVVSYTAPVLSRIPRAFLLQAHTRAAEWQPYVRYDWPHNNNMLGKLAVNSGHDQFSLMGYTGNLEIAAGAGGDLYPLHPLAEGFADPLHSAPYITIHHGADPAMGSSLGSQTKTLDAHVWCKLVAQCNNLGLRVVQLGLANEEAIPGVDFDHRGHLPLHQTAMVIKHATLHVDTEGGLVHVAKAMGTPCVVVFGPTSVGFLAIQITSISVHGCAGIAGGPPELGPPNVPPKVASRPVWSHTKPHGFWRR